MSSTSRQTNNKKSKIFLKTQNLSNTSIIFLKNAFRDSYNIRKNVNKKLFLYLDNILYIIFFVW